MGKSTFGNSPGWVKIFAILGGIAVVGLGVRLATGSSSFRPMPRN